MKVAVGALAVSVSVSVWPAYGRAMA